MSYFSFPNHSLIIWIPKSLSNHLQQTDNYTLIHNQTTKMSSHTHSNLPATENNLRKEFKSLLNDRTRQIAREFVLLERTVNTLENNFAFSDRDKNKRIKELEDTVKRGFVGQNKKIDEIESKVRKLEREVREKEKSIEDLMKMNSDKENRIRSLERR